MRTAAVLLSACFLTAAAAHASIIVGTPNFGDCYPFTCNDSGTNTGQSIEYQQVYDATTFSSGINISAITLFDAYSAKHFGGKLAVLSGNYDISFSITPASAGGLSNTLANNVGSGGLTTFFDGHLGGPIKLNMFTIPGSVFSYNPKLGNLLIDIRVTNQTIFPNGTGNSYVDADNTGLFTSRAYQLGNSTTGAVDSAGLVSEFTGTTFTVSPEPGTMLLLSGGLLALVAIRKRSRAALLPK